MTWIGNLATTCVLVAQTVQLLFAPVALVSLLQPALAVVICGRKNIALCVRQHKCGILEEVGHCEEFDPAVVHRAKMEEKDFIDKMGVYDVVPRSDAAEKKGVIRTRWVTVNKKSDDAPQLRAGWVAQEFRGRCGDKHEYFSETPDLALVKAVVAHAARLVESEDIVVAVVDVWRAYFYAEEKRDFC